MSDLTPAAVRHLEAFLREAGVVIVSGSLTIQFDHEAPQKIEVKTFHRVSGQKALENRDRPAHTRTQR